MTAASSTTVPTAHGDTQPPDQPGSYPKLVATQSISRPSDSIVRPLVHRPVTAMSSRKRAYPEGEVDEHKESDDDAAAAGSDSDSESAPAAAAAAASAAAPALALTKRPRVEEAAAAAAGGAASSSLLPPRTDMPECDKCKTALDSSEKRGDEASGRLPRLLPCGHCYCSKCISEMLQRSDKSVDWIASSAVSSGPAHARSSHSADSVTLNLTPPAALCLLSSSVCPFPASSRARSDANSNKSCVSTRSRICPRTSR